MNAMNAVTGAGWKASTRLATIRASTSCRRMARTGTKKEACRSQPDTAWRLQASNRTSNTTKPFLHSTPTTRYFVVSNARRQKSRRQVPSTRRLGLARLAASSPGRTRNTARRWATASTP
eukprot:6086383-Alexandrium_andersonii.AAC.1